MAGLASYTRTLAALKSENIGARGVLVVLRDCERPIRVTMQRQNTRPEKGEKYTILMQKGEKWLAPTEFDVVVVENLAGFAQTVHLLIGYGDYQEPPPSVAVADKFLGRPWVVFDGVDIQLAAATNKQRRKLVVRASEDNTSVVRISGRLTDIENSRALGLIPGASIPIEATGPLYAFSETIGDILEVMEEEFGALPVHFAELLAGDVTDDDLPDVTTNLAIELSAGDIVYDRGLDPNPEIGAWTGDLNAQLQDGGAVIRPVYVVLRANGEILEFAIGRESSNPVDTPATITALMLTKSDGTSVTVLIADAQSETTAGPDAYQGQDLVYRAWVWDFGAEVNEFSEFFVVGEDYKLTLIA